jgi:long-chain fatty acid transport protein
MKKHLFAASLLLSAVTSFGAGYQLNLQGLRQLAMGGSGTGWVWDASTIFYNPGGLARLNGIQVYASGLVIAPSTAYGNQANSGMESTSIRTKSRTFVPFNIYVGGPIQQDSRFALGLGIYTAAGIGITWDDNWLGKYIVQSIDMKAVFFQPTFSYRISDFLSVGGGFIYANGSLDLRKAVSIHSYSGPNLDDGEAHLHGSANGVGFNLGVHLKMGDHIQAGLTYRSQVNMNLGGGLATFTVPASLKSEFPDTHFDSQLPLPQVATFGIGVRPGERLTLQFDLSYTGWNSFDSLRLNFADHTSSLKDMHEPRHYENTMTPRIGACYKLGKVVSVMLGGAYDPTPVANGYVSPDLPDANRIIVTGGISVKPLPGFTILAAFEGVTSMKRASAYDYGSFYGTYKTQAATTGLGIYYNF